MTKDGFAINTLSGRLLWARKRAGLTQMQLAKKSCVSQGTISDIERDRTTEGYTWTLLRLAAALEININWLTAGVGSPDDLRDTNKAALHDMIDGMTPEQVSIAKGLLRVVANNGD